MNFDRAPTPWERTFGLGYVKTQFGVTSMWLVKLKKIITINL